MVIESAHIEEPTLLLIANIMLGFQYWFFWYIISWKL